MTNAAAKTIRVQIAIRLRNRILLNSENLLFGMAGINGVHRFLKHGSILAVAQPIVTKTGLADQSG